MLYFSTNLCTRIKLGTQPGWEQQPNWTYPLLLEEMSGVMCLQTVTSTVMLKWNDEFLMPECFCLLAVSLCGDWLQNWQSAWGRGFANSDKTLTHQPARPLVWGDDKHHQGSQWLHSLLKFRADYRPPMHNARILIILYDPLQAGVVQRPHSRWFVLRQRPWAWWRRQSREQWPQWAWRHWNQYFLWQQPRRGRHRYIHIMLQEHPIAAMFVCICSAALSLTLNLSLSVQLN